jgi:tetratricopeptide (TPR) repeat protein
MDQPANDGHNNRFFQSFQRGFGRIDYRYFLLKMPHVHGWQNREKTIYFSEINSTPYTLVSMAAMQRKRGEGRSALENYHQALGLAMDIKERYLECEIRNDLGLLYTEIGQFEEADNHLRQALLNARDRKAPNQEAMALVNLGKLYERKGNLPEAARTALMMILLANSVRELWAVDIIIWQMSTDVLCQWHYQPASSVVVLN